MSVKDLSLDKEVEFSKISKECWKENYSSRETVVLNQKSFGLKAVGDFFKAVSKYTQGSIHSLHLQNLR